MKKRIALLLVCCILMCGGLTGCCEIITKDDNLISIEDHVALEIADFKPVPEMDGVVYNLDTKVMFYMFTTERYSGDRGYGYGYFGAYLNENCKPCRYINGEIVEMVD